MPINYLPELPPDIKEVVAYSAKNWPKTLTSETLLRELDMLARRVYVLMTTARPQEGWQQIETAPKDGTAVMLCSVAFRKAGETMPLTGVGRWSKATDDSECDGWEWPYHLYPVTHWMPLQAPPAVAPQPLEK